MFWFHGQQVTVPTENLIYVVMIEVNDADHMLPSSLRHRMSDSLTCDRHPSPFTSVLICIQLNPTASVLPAPACSHEIFGRLLADYN
jgi:hypothetical protein